MDCPNPMQSALEQLRSGDASTEDMSSLLQKCPQICDAVYGTRDFDLGGIGVCIAVAFQTIFFLLVGNLQAFISYILPKHAKSSLRLAVARFQIVFDTAYSTGTFFNICVIVASYIRLRDNPGTYERSDIQDLLSILSLLQTLALVAHWTQRQPTNIKFTRRWGDMTVWPVWLLTTVSRDHLKMVAGRTPSAVLSKMCEKAAPEKYPYVNTPGTGYIWLLPIFLGFALAIVLVILNETVRSSIWLWVRKVFGSQLAKIVFMFVWTVSNLLSLGFETFHYFYVRQKMFASKQDVNGRPWDLGQVVAVLLFLPTAYQIWLTLLVTIKPAELREGGGVARRFISVLFIVTDFFYEMNVGSGNAPKVQDDDEEDEKNTHGSHGQSPIKEKLDGQVSTAEKTAQPEQSMNGILEKVPLLESQTAQMSR